MGQTALTIDNALTNHSFVDLRLVGSVDSSSVQCHTDLPTCCSGAQGSHRGDWFFPDGERVPNLGERGIFRTRGAQTVYLGRTTNRDSSPSGIYRCEVPTTAVHDDGDTSVRETVYVGAYTTSGGNIAKNM